MKPAAALVHDIANLQAIACGLSADPVLLADPAVVSSALASLCAGLARVRATLEGAP